MHPNDLTTNRNEIIERGPGRKTTTFFSSERMAVQPSQVPKTQPAEATKAVFVVAICLCYFHCTSRAPNAATAEPNSTASSSTRSPATTQIQFIFYFFFPHKFRNLHIPSHLHCRPRWPRAVPTSEISTETFTKQLLSGSTSTQFSRRSGCRWSARITRKMPYEASKQTKCELSRNQKWGSSDGWDGTVM